MKISGLAVALGPDVAWIVVSGREPEVFWDPAVGKGPKGSEPVLLLGLLKLLLAKFGSGSGSADLPLNSATASENCLVAALNESTFTPKPFFAISIYSLNALI